MGLCNCGKSLEWSDSNHWSTENYPWLSQFPFHKGNFLLFLVFCCMNARPHYSAPHTYTHTQANMQFKSMSMVVEMPDLSFAVRIPLKIEINYKQRSVASKAVYAKPTSVSLFLPFHYLSLSLSAAEENFFCSSVWKTVSFYHS